MKRTVGTTISLFVILSLATVAVWAQVSPPSVIDSLYPGESVEVTKLVDVPGVTPKLDFFLIVDLSGSYFDDVDVIQGLAPDLFDDVRAGVADSRFGLGSFVDFPFFPWGLGGTTSPGVAPGLAQGGLLAPDADPDYAYRLDQDLTATKATWLTAVGAMATLDGMDLPESQYEALYQAATGNGRQMPPTTDGDYTDPGEIAPNQDPSWRADATHVIAITTDASFHVGGETDPSYPFAYPGPTRNETVNALNAAGIKVIALKAPDAGSEMDDIAAATGGVVKTTTSSSSDIADAILEAIEELEFDITPVPEGCDPLDVSFVPPVRQDVPGGSQVSFEETILVPDWVEAEDLPVDCQVDCRVDFYADNVVIGSQQIRIDVPICAPPPPPPPPPATPFVPEASTLILLGSAASGLAGYAGLQWRARRRK